ncbi:MAG TPA: hypothetical protein VHO29_13670 [Marmoricola sp.]|nr:hypothetical protein [Marmoricola sp.]
MTENPAPSTDDERVARRAELLPEEAAAGSEDPQHQAEQILQESDDRTEHPEETGRESSQTSSPDERPL